MLVVDIIKESLVQYIILAFFLLYMLLVSNVDSHISYLFANFAIAYLFLDGFNYTQNHNLTPCRNRFSIAMFVSFALQVLLTSIFGKINQTWALLIILAYIICMAYMYYTIFGSKEGKSE